MLPILERDYGADGDGTAGVLDPPGMVDGHIPGPEDPEEPFANANSSAPSLPMLLDVLEEPAGWTFH
ncbi:hypothetical protein [Streptomyces boninensis]|uniref:hypothetical protein n=1 Tax=Streptomyces boninensis TaxID=2039455 RepID=UPI003B224898